MATTEIDLVLDAIPTGEEDMTPEQRAQYETIVREYEAGHARLVDHEDVPEVLAEIARMRAA
jgi:hypothetical protein